MRILLFILSPLFAFAQVQDTMPVPTEIFELQPYETYKDCFESNKTNYIVTGSLVFLEGALNGVAEDLQFHYGEFKNTFPKANDDFWNPDESWKRKYRDVSAGDYRERYPFSTTALAFTTDGYHLVRTSQRLMFTTSLVMTYDKKKNWKHYLRDAIFYTVVRSVGFHTTYTLIIR